LLSAGQPNIIAGISLHPILGVGDADMFRSGNRRWEMKDATAFRRSSIALIAALSACLLTFLAGGSAYASNCEPYSSNGAIHLICVPDRWNGSLIVYAHGYVSPEEQPSPTLPAETAEVMGIAHSLGFAFATTSYPDLGLVVPEGVEDLAALVSEFKSAYPHTRHVYLVGVSEGGLATALAVERHPGVFSGGLACCGPVGDFRKQIDYFGDFFVVFNYFFPGVLPDSSPLGVDGQVISKWESTYKPAVKDAIKHNPSATRQLLKVTNAATDPADPASVEKTILDILWYDVFATNDAINKLGGQPFDNSRRWYSGSDNDWQLNRRIQRVVASPNALAAIARDYQTSGRLRMPLVTMHTAGDPVVPYWHESLYWLKALLNGSAWLHTNLPIVRYGHCNFTTGELVGAFALLVLKVSGQDLFIR
jgi:pimeloyl-ACP methyl ester carboxylesterase